MGVIPVELDCFRSTSTTATFLLHLTLLWTRTQAQSQLFASHDVIAAPGDDVVLRCYLDPPLSLEDLTVEWSKPNLLRVGYVHLYRNRHEVTDMKLPSYAGRTQLFTDQLRHGNMSLKILNVTLEDAGRYRCFIPRLSSPVKEATVQLAVDPYMRPTEPQLDPRCSNSADPDEYVDSAACPPGRSYVITAVIFSFGLILGVGIGCFLIHKKRKTTESKQSLQLCHRQGEPDQC